MYHKSIVTFLDILGFGDLVKNSEYNVVKNILDDAENSIIPKNKDKHLNEPEVVSFSDSIVRVRKIDSKSNIDYPIGLFFNEVLSLVHAQGELIDSNILIRGSVSIGDIFIEGSRVFGPGLIEAYELESKYANYPRIIIDQRLIQEYKSNKLLKAEWHNIEQELEILKGMLRQGDDGMWFIDYAKAIKQEFDTSEMYFTFLQKHREVILSGAQNHAKIKAILSKYIWMANYHNQIISDISTHYFEDYGLDKNDFNINSENIPALQYLEP